MNENIYEFDVTFIDAEGKTRGETYVYPDCDFVPGFFTDAEISLVNDILNNKEIAKVIDVSVTYAPKEE